MKTLTNYFEDIFDVNNNNVLTIGDKLFNNGEILKIDKKSITIGQSFLGYISIDEEGLHNFFRIVPKGISIIYFNGAFEINMINMKDDANFKKLSFISKHRCAINVGDNLTIQNLSIDCSECNIKSFGNTLNLYNTQIKCKSMELQTEDLFIPTLLDPKSKIDAPQHIWSSFRELDPLSGVDEIFDEDVPAETVNSIAQKIGLGQKGIKTKEVNLTWNKFGYSVNLAPYRNQWVIEK